MEIVENLYEFFFGHKTIHISIDASERSFEAVITTTKFLS